MNLNKKVRLSFMEKCEVCGEDAPKYRMGCIYPSPSDDWSSPYCSACIDITMLNRKTFHMESGIITLFVDDHIATPEEVRDLILEQKKRKKYHDVTFICK